MNEARDGSHPVVDAHTHVFSPDVIDGRTDTVNQEAWFGHLYADPKARLASAADLLASMAAAGITQAVMCGFPWRDLGRCRAHNDYMADAATRSGGRLSWLAIVPPHGGRAAANEADRAFALGAAGLGELNADAQGFDPRDAAALEPVVDVCQQYDRPVLLHTSEPVGHGYPGKGTATPDKVLAFAAAFPDLTLVLAHWGGGLPFYELMPEVATALRRVVYDCAASTYLYRFDVFRTVVDLVGPDRVVFGSDFPLLGQGRFLRRAQDAGLADAAIPLVFADNARRVYRLNSPADEKGRPQ